MAEQPQAPKPPSPARPWRGVTHGGSFGHAALMWILPRLGLRFVYAVTACVIPFYMLFARKGYLAMRDYFGLRWGYRGLRRLRAIYRNHYWFAQAMMDRFACFAGMQDRFTVEVESNPDFLAALDRPEGMLVAGAHVGNMELCGVFFPHPQKPFLGLVYGMEEAVLQQIRRSSFAGNHTDMVAVKEDMSHVLALHRALEAGNAVILHCDRSLLGKKTHRLPFLGAPAAFPLGAFQIAALTRLPLFAVFAMREKAATYKVYVKTLAPELPEEASNAVRAQAYCAAYVAALEEILAQYPEQWYNFYPFWQTLPDKTPSTHESVTPA